MEHLEVRLWTQRDPVLSKVLQFALQGWPEQVAPELKSFFHCRDELSVEDNCIMWGHRIIIPPQGRQ